MKGRYIALIVLTITAGAAVLPSGGQEIAPIKLTPSRVMEQRSIALDVPWETFQRPPGWKGTLVLTVRLEGAAASHATRWRNLQIDEAVDDLGNKVVLAPVNPFLPEGWRNKGPWEWVQQPENDPGASKSPAVQFDLEGCARRATRIARLKGQFILQTGGQEIVIVLPKLKSAIGTVVHDAPLAAAGLELGINGSESNPPDNDLKVTLKGASWALGHVDIVDSANVSVTNGPTRVPLNDPTTLHLSSPAADSMTLRATIVYGQTLAKVPFDLRGIPLP